MGITNRDRADRARAQTEEMRLEFIKTELELGATLLDLAETELTWESKEDADGVLARADKACWEACRQVAKAKLHNQDTAVIEVNLQKLQSDIDALQSRIERAKRKSV